MPLLFAFSLQEQVEKYGAYVALAAFLGLAVLTVLYFAQARELKRLRDWAGRAPERAQELEARVVAQADELRRTQTGEPVAEPSGTVGPARPIEQPAAAAVPSGTGRGTGTPAPIPIGPRPAVAVAAAAAKAQAGAVAPEEPEVAEATSEPVAAPSGDGALATPPPPDQTAVLAPADRPVAPSDDEEAGDQPPAPPDDEGTAPAEEGTGEQPAAPDDEDAGDEAAPPPADEPAAEPATSGNGTGATPPIPRATPRPQPRTAAAAAPLRASAPSRSVDVPPRRGATVPGRREEGSSRARRITLFTLLGVVVLGGFIFAATQVLGGDDENTPAPNVAQSPTSSASPSADVAGKRPDTVVTVLNGTATDGLAGTVRDKLVAQGYSDEVGMVRTGNNTDQQRQNSIVLYASGQRRMARDVARILGISGRPELVDEDTLALANNTGDGAAGHETDVVVVAGPDQAP